MSARQATRSKPAAMTTAHPTEDTMHVMTDRTPKAHAPATPTEDAMPTTTPAPDPTLDEVDARIAANRASPIVAASAIPRRPASFRPTAPRERLHRLRKVAADQRHQLLAALVEASGRGDGLREDLGRRAPDARLADQIAERLEQSRRALAAATELAEYLREADQIAVNDAVRFVEAELRLFTRAAEDDSALTERYRALATFAATRSARIAEAQRRRRKIERARSRPPTA